MSRPTLEYASPSPRDRLLTWLLPTGPLVLFSTGLACYLGSLAIRFWGLARYEAMLDLRIALEGLSALLLAVGVLWGIVAAFRTRRPVAFAGLACCAVSLAFVVYHVFLRVKK